MSNKKLSDIELSTKLWSLLRREIKPSKMKKAKVNPFGVTYELLPETTDRIPMAYAQISDDLPEDLSVGAMKLVLRIARELLYGNYLWYFDHGNQKNLRSALNELRSHNILLKTSCPTVHIVNPMFISKGEAIRVASHSMECIANHNKACPEAIVALSEIPHINPQQITETWSFNK